MAEAKPRTTTSERPMSPHLQIYRWPITMLTSITHRATGMANAAGTLLLAAWLVSLTAGPEAYAMVMDLMASILGRIVLLGFTWSMSFHLLNGIRHLFWDAGHGFELTTANATGKLVLFLSVLVTIAIWVLAYSVRGGGA